MSALPSLEAEVEEFDPVCEWVEAALGEECGADGTVFAVADALLVPAPFSTTGSVVRRRANSPTIIVCPGHLVAALDAHDDPFGCSLVMPMADRPRAGRPAGGGR